MMSNIVIENVRKLNTFGKFISFFVISINDDTRSKILKISEISVM